MAKPRFRDLKKGKKRREKKETTKRIKVQYADNKTKSKAAIVDSFMILMPIMYIVFYLVMGSRDEFAENRIMGWLYILIPLITIQTLFMMFGNGQTPGYRNYGIKVVDANNFEKPSPLALILRNFGIILSLVTILGWLLMFYRKDNRGLHDLISGTAIITV